MDVIIIGAGATGLFAARELAKAGQKVIVLEARDRIGGRIYTSRLQNITVEAGAEFIHGNLPMTLKLLKEAAIPFEEVTGDMWQVKGGRWNKENNLLADDDLLTQRLSELKDNISIAEFLDKEFRGSEYVELRQGLISYVEGYYSADVNRTSALAFYKEWQTEDEQQYRPAGGYINMINYLADECVKAGCIIQTSTIVKQVRWYKGLVEVFDETHHCYTARKVIITLPIGVLAAEANEKGAITFSPEIPEKIDAAKRMGFGHAVKILLQMKTSFWQNNEALNNKIPSDLGFVFSDQTIGTWWTQLPQSTPVLTGWIAGPPAVKLKHNTDKEIVRMAIHSLSSIFKVLPQFIEDQLLASHVFNWVVDPFTRGAYAYSTTDTEEARRLLSEPVENSLFFAGEALYNGLETGTVEAALTSGKEVAEKVRR
jgi:monoamine oxidase